MKEFLLALATASLSMCSPSNFTNLALASECQQVSKELLDAAKIGDEKRVQKLGRLQGEICYPETPATRH